MSAQRPGSSKEGIAVVEEVGEAKTDRLDLLAEGLALEQGWSRRCDRRRGQQVGEAVGEEYRRITGLTFETKEILESSP